MAGHRHPSNIDMHYVSFPVGIDKEHLRFTYGLLLMLQLAVAMLHTQKNILLMDVHLSVRTMGARVRIMYRIMCASGRPFVRTTQSIEFIGDRRFMFVQVLQLSLRSRGIPTSESALPSISSANSEV